MATRDEIEKVRDATNLVDLIGEHVALQPRGREHVGLCPFHDDSRPSFAVVTHKQAAFYKCHACGAAGDCFRFVQEHLGKEFGEALGFLAERAGIELSTHQDEGQDRRRSRRAWLRKALEAAQAHFQANLGGDAGRDARAAIEARGISDEMVKQFGIGAAGSGWSTLRDAIEGEAMPEKVLVAAGLLKQNDEGHTYDAFRHRLMFPILDDSGQPIAFGGRVLDPSEEPKYLNSCEHDLFHKSRTLYGMHAARRSIMQCRKAIVAEGYTDVIACHQAGITNVVATLGTAMTPDHGTTLARLCDVTILLFDGDEAGQRAAERAVPIMAQHDVDVRICVLPDGLDPDALLKETDGCDRFNAALEQSEDAFAFLLSRLTIRVEHAQGVSGRQRTIEEFIDLIARNGMGRAAPLRRAMLVGRLAELAGVASAVIDDLLRRTEAKHARPNTPDEPVEEHLLAAGMDAVELAPALRRSELDLVAIALHGEASPKALQLFRSGTLADPQARRIAAAIASVSDQGGEVTVQGVLDALDHEDDRSLASDLYFEGRRTLDCAKGDAAAAFEQCEMSFERCHQEMESQQRMTDWKASAARDPEAAAAVIEHLRGLGPRVAAVPRPVDR